MPKRKIPPAVDWRCPDCNSRTALWYPVDKGLKKKLYCRKCAERVMGLRNAEGMLIDLEKHL